MAAPRKNVLVVEDDPGIGRELEETLRLENFRVCRVSRADEARRSVRREAFQLILLDVELPDGSGFDLCRSFRDEGIVAPILFLTARADEASVVKGLGLGAVDYLRKPFGFVELMARIRLRTADKRGDLKFGRLVLSLDARELSCGKKTLTLPPKEFLILQCLMERAGEAVTREWIMQNAFRDDDATDRVIDPHVSRLRKRLAELGSTNCQIRSVSGVGYRLEKL